MEQAEDTATGADQFRAFLAEIGESQSGFARTLIRMGDDRGGSTVLRHIQRMATGEARISGEMRVIMSMFKVAAQAETEPPIGLQSRGAGHRKVARLPKR